ncbi:diacylglycerol/lipid kinase family protein [Arcticibacter sp.]|uniref:diacylglycerol/lipid kinase family protein n=1 Tax=Arcticibacter sp. TaxID=1872630 RepID=UPI00388F6902
MRVLFIINTRSGHQNEGSLKALIQNSSEELNYDYSIFELRKDFTEDQILKAIEQFKPEKLGVAGGDGTVNLIAKLIHNTSLPMLIIPTGSANGMANELGIGGRFEGILNLLKDGVNRPIDVLKINEKICIHLGDVGLNARIVKRFDEDPRRGLITYAKYLFREVFLIKQYSFLIRIDGKQFKRRAVSLTFANASKYGTGAVINPMGVIDDGKFELVIVKPFPRIKLLSIAWKMFTNCLQTSEYVEVHSCRKLQVRSSKRTTLQVDGEICGRVDEIHAEIIPSCLTMIVPVVQAEE